MKSHETLGGLLLKTSGGKYPGTEKQINAYAYLRLHESHHLSYKIVRSLINKPIYSLDSSLDHKVRYNEINFDYVPEDSVITARVIASIANYVGRAEKLLTEDEQTKLDKMIYSNDKVLVFMAIEILRSKQRL